MNYILYGKQYPMIKKRLNKLLKDNLKEVDDFNVVKLDNEECSIDDIVNECSMLPLGYEKKAVVVDNVNFLNKVGKNGDTNKILDFLKTNDDSIDLYLIVRNDIIDEKSPIAKYIFDNGLILNFVNLSKNDWPKYVKKYFNDRKVEIDDSATNELIYRVDGDLSRFLNEADKLCLYKNKINLMDVALMVSKPIEDDAFQMSNALFRGDNATALSIFRDLQLLGSKSTDTLIPMLASQFRFISQVCYLYDKGLSNEEISKELACNPFRVKMALQNSKYLSRKQIASVLDDLYHLDYQIKSGRIDRFYGLELFLINFPN